MHRVHSGQGHLWNGVRRRSHSNLKWYFDCGMMTAEVELVIRARCVVSEVMEKMMSS